MYKYKKIAYFVVIPFKDTGNLLEYFQKNSEEFYLYLFPPSYKNQASIINYYKKGKLSRTETLWFYKGNNKLLIHIFYFIYYFYILFKYKITNTYIIFYFPLFLFLNSAMTFFTGNKYVFWIWDYFPTKSGVMSIYNSLVKHYNNSLQYVLYLSPTLRKIYASRIDKEKVRKVVSFGIKNLKLSRKIEKNKIGFIGNLRPGQGIEFLIEVAKQNEKIRIDIIGDGPLRKELEIMVKRYKLSNTVTFYGFVTNQELLKIVKKWEVAVAPYIPTKDNPTMYTEPGKIKLYAELGLPVLMTKVSYIYKELIKYNAGADIDLTYQSFMRGLNKIQKNYPHYEVGVTTFKKANLFESYYDNQFTFLKK